MNWWPKRSQDEVIDWRVTYVSWLYICRDCGERFESPEKYAVPYCPACIWVNGLSASQKDFYLEWLEQEIA